MALVVKNVDAGVVLSIIRTIYGYLRPWLKEQAAKTETPVDDWMLNALDAVLGIK